MSAAINIVKASREGALVGLGTSWARPLNGAREHGEPAPLGWGQLHGSPEFCGHAGSG
jgi:hypothetical protein